MSSEFVIMTGIRVILITDEMMKRHNTKCKYILVKSLRGNLLQK